MNKKYKKKKITLKKSSKNNVSTSPLRLFDLFMCFLGNNNIKNHVNKHMCIVGNSVSLSMQLEDMNKYIYIYLKMYKCTGIIFHIDQLYKIQLFKKIK